MKKTLSMLAVLGIVLTASVQSANAFSWNPATWFGSGKCPKCEKPKKCDPCSTGYAAPCNPCEKKKIEYDPCQKQTPCPVQQTCDPCDKLQNMNK